MAVEWTQEARAHLDRVLERAVPETGEAALLRRDEMRGRIEADLAANAQGVLSEHDIDAAARRIGLELMTPESKAQPVRAPLTKPSGCVSGWALLVCVVGTAVVLVVELSSRMCAEAFFDPLPTPAYALLVAAVGVASLLGLFALRAEASDAFVRKTALALGFALPVAIVYFLAFLPLVPLAVSAILFAGIGILPLIPVLCAPTLGWLAFAVARRSSQSGTRVGRRMLAGIAASVLVLALLEAPNSLTRRWVHTAATGTADERSRALSRLRAFGSDELLQRLASGDTESAIGPLWLLMQSGDELTTKDARDVWFRVHGTPFRGPLSDRATPFFSGGDTSFDSDIGGATVGVGQRGLELAGSRIDAAVDGTAGVAYLEWTIQVANSNEFGELEARAIVDLPDEAVVSRATLWIDGEEREAAYARTSAVRSAYQSVAVEQRRDPLLVTSAGDDLVLVQAFPVNAGSKLTWKLGITIPLELDGRTARMPWPRVIDQNFPDPWKIRPSVWIQSHEELACEGLSVARTDSGWEARGEFATSVLVGPLAPPKLSVQREDAEAVHCELDETRTLVCEFIVPAPEKSNVPVIALDGSRALRSLAEPIAESLRTELAGSRAFIAEDAGARSVDIGQSFGLSDLGSSAWDGGVDDVPALEAAWDLARELGTDVVWLCGPQPVLLSSLLGLQQRFEREPAGPRIICCMLVPGENRVLTELAGEPRIERVPFEGDVIDSLRRARGRSGMERRWSVVDSRPSVARTGPKHLAALWASAQVEELLREAHGNVERREAATALAQQHHLVTRVSGAVVLETAAQFAANELSAAEAESLPSVPEPEVAALLIVVLAAALVAAAARRKCPTG